MHHYRLCIAPLALLIAGCAATPQTPPAARYAAPWAELSKPAFPDLLASYGASNLATRREETLDRYLRSQTKTFDRYVAAKEVGVGAAPLQQEATAEIQALAATLPTRRFLARTSFTVQPYDAQLGGFPLYQQPFDLNASLRYVNDDVRTTTSTQRQTRGMSVAAAEFGFMEAEVRFSKVGWVIPATPDQAVRILETLSQSGGERKVAVAMTFTLNRCDATGETSRMFCEATIQNLSAYNSLDAVQPNNPPVVELVKRG